MSRQNLTYIVCFFFILYILAHALACKKEYSFEGTSNEYSAIPGDSVDHDSLITPAITLPTCKECNIPNTSPAFRWSFKTGRSLLCGNVTKAVLSPDRNAMTFFGPSTCSADSGLIITAYFLNRKLDKDQDGFTADVASLEYYDNITRGDILQSKPPNILTVTFDSYKQQTGIASGSFTGLAVDKHGYVTRIEAGRFTVKF